MTPVVVLVGPPGAGKTAVGSRVARRIGVAFRDTDADVERRAGQPVSDIFVTRGEDAFRALEREAVVRALAEHDGVLALGGGAVMDPATQQDLRDHKVVFLDVGLADAMKRVGLNRARPLLLGNVRGQWTDLMGRRRPVYEAIASRAVVTDRRSVGAVADEIVDWLEEAP